MRLPKLDSILERLRTDFHVPVAVMVFVTVTVYHFRTGHDLGTNYVNSIYAMYAFLGGHAIAQMKYSSDGSDSGDTAK